MSPTAEGETLHSSELIAVNGALVSFERELNDVGGRIYASGMLTTQEKGIVKW